MKLPATKLPSITIVVRSGRGYWKKQPPSFRFGHVNGVWTDAIETVVLRPRIRRKDQLMVVRYRGKTYVVGGGIFVANFFILSDKET
jgi:hypothetical protein